MNRPGSRNRKNKKKIRGALAGAGIVALFLALMISFGKTAPENPMDRNRADASRMYLLSSTLDMDMDQLANIGNANINAGDSANQAEQEEQQQEEEKQEQNQDTPQQEQQQNQDTQNPDQNISDPNIQNAVAADIPGSLMNLIQKNQSGGSGNGSSDQPGDDQGNGSGDGTTGGNSGIPSDGGQQTTLNPSQSAALFTTSLKDGDEVTDPEYPFTVDLTEKGKQLTLVSMTVNLNGSGRICRSRDSLTLKEGANSVYVTVRFRDSKYNQIDASTKIYTIYYYPENEVELVVRNARTGEYINDQDALTVMQDSFWIEVRARKASGGVINDVAARVRLNNKIQKADSDGIYRMGLILGNNQLKVTAGEGGNTQKTISCTVNYKIDNFMISFESSIRTEKISNNPGIGDKVFKGITKLKYASTSGDFSFRVRNSTVTGVEKIDKIQMTNRYGTLDITDLAGADGYIQITLDASRSTDIKVYCTDSDGEPQWYTWSVTYERVLDPAENQRKAPVIRADVTNETVNKNPFIIPIKVFDYNGNELKANQNFTLYLNGAYQDYHSRETDGTYEYNLVLTEGPNTVVIKAVDNEGYTAEKTLTVTYNPVAEEARVRVIVSGEVLGLGTMIDETITAKSDQTVAQIVENRLAAHGYSTIHDGVADADSYFLRHVMKTGITDGWSISAEERSLLEMLGYDIAEGPKNPNSLGERDFTAGSGWMVTLNHYYIAQTMGTRPIRDGDEIHLIYTLSVGKDIGVDTSSSIYD